MKDRDAKRQTKGLVLEYDIDAPPGKVWRAVSIPEFREHWLPGKDLVDPGPLSTEPEGEVCYRMRDDDPPFLESIVKIRVSPNANGGTSLRIIHYLVDQRLNQQTPPAANSNGPLMMLAA